MKIAIVQNDKRRTNKCPKEKKPFLWAEKWKELSIDNGFEYRMFDSFDPNFIDKLLDYNPWRALWRSIGDPLMKFKDEGQRQLLDIAGLRVVPNWKTHYLYDHKIRQSYLFKLRDIPHPETKVFFNEPYALEYINEAMYPFVVKADGGAGGKSFQLIENKEQALDLVCEIFQRKGKWTGREYESCIFYTQEYIPAPGVWRIWMFKDKVATGHFVNNAEGTLKASGRGRISYPEFPIELFKMTMEINNSLQLDWCMYDIIWSKKHKKFLILEITDTIVDRDRENRTTTYYRKEEEWIPEEKIESPPETIFNLFVLEEV